MFQLHSNARKFVETRAYGPIQPKEGIMDDFHFETKVTVYKDEEVQHGGLSRNSAKMVAGDQIVTVGDQWCWVPSHGLPRVEEGKKVVLLYPCDCGCWRAESTKRSIDLINQDPNPDRFVLVEVDPRYIVRKDESLWHISNRPPRYTGAG